jgi:hypothetical protein
VPRVVEELLGAKLVAPPPSTVDNPSPLAVGGKVEEGFSMIICAPSLSTVTASVVVCEPTAMQLLLLPSQVPETRSSFVQLAALGVSPMVPPPPSSVGSSSSEGLQRVNQPKAVDASSSPPKYEAFEVMFGSSLVVFPTSPVRRRFLSCCARLMLWGAMWPPRVRPRCGGRSSV